MQKHAIGENWGAAADRVRADFAGFREAEVLSLGSKQFGLFRLGEMKSWKQRQVFGLEQSTSEMHAWQEAEVLQD